ncbi:MAG: Hsp70 family protein, partial [Victivallales bacterium]|nr:Hsp70 family protein [Victivallales bacterium]
MESRFAIGIDLGTTNSSVFYVDLEAEKPSPTLFPILQLVAPGETAAEPLLPSFTYLPGKSELPEGALSLPWDTSETHAVGRFARDQGALLPDRLVASAKSWLAHPGVNRRNRILPWGSDLGQQAISPLTASFYYLEHIRNAWDNAFAKLHDHDGSPCTMASQNVIITVPASFDETARTLTLEAATLAGLQHVTLLEEPLAAFYSWLNRHPDNWLDAVPEGSKVLVVDVGGGTTDFSIIDIQGSTLRRTAVGEHILLGGDNMDIALAHVAQQKWNTKLPQRQWTQLCHACRHAKETLLSPDAPESLEVRIAGPGSSLFAKSKSYHFEQKQVESLIMEGFLPIIPANSPAPERRRGIQEMGLPYAADPAITKHILQFLRQPDGFIRPTHLLFNGGAMLPQLLRNRILDAVAEWCGGARPVELSSFNLSLAVSEGAACYALARSGRSIRVKGGIARAYFLEVANSDKLVCIMPRDTDEGIRQDLTSCTFKLRTNQTVSFPLYSSATRLGDKIGDFIPKDDSLTPLPPLCTSIKYGKSTTGTVVDATISA